MTPPTANGRRTQPAAGTKVTAAVLCLIPVVALMWVPSYTRTTPKLWGFPFFYWYTILWLFLSTGFVVAAYVLLQRARRDVTGADREESRP